MTFTVYDKTIQISDPVCNLYKTFVGFPLNDRNLRRLTDIYMEEFHLSPETLTGKELETIATEMICDEICANMGESVEDAQKFLEQKGYL